MIDPDEIEIEPVRGLPAVLPAGETMLWQGAPDWRALARTAFHVRAVALYFALLIGWRVLAGWHDGAAAADVAASAAWLCVAAAGALAILSGLAFAYARTTVYTLTSRRLVIRSGLALPITVNLPFEQIASAAVKRRRDGTGDVSFTLAKPNRLALLVVWPHARPLAWANPQPTLRAVADIDRVAGLVGEALGRSAGTAPVAIEAEPARRHADLPFAAGAAA